MAEVNFVCEIKGSISNIHIEPANICNVLPRPAFSSGLYTLYYTLYPHIVYQALAYMQFYNKLYKNISVVNGLSSEYMFRFSNIVQTLEENGSVL